MATPSGLPKVGETWTLTRKLPPDWKPNSVTVTIVERGRGDYWSLRVRYPDGRVALWVDASYHWSRGDLKETKP